MKIAVTAVTGQLGSAVVHELKKEIGAEHVVGIARSPEKATHLGIQVRKGDYNNLADLNLALSGMDKVLLISGMDDPKSRIQQHRNVIEASRQNGVKKVVYTSIVGDEQQTSFSPIVKSNRQTELDVSTSGLNWVIGRNGIYIEPDLEYIDTYIKEGAIRNCAGDGKCAYTSREELAIAYTKLLLKDKHDGQIYNLVGEPITQAQLAEYINQVFNTNLTYKPVPVDIYEKERKAELGDFLGAIVAGVYNGIMNGVNDLPSDFEKVLGRPHKSPIEMMKSFKSK